ncbi:vegetative cell wall protein gp1-like [Cervus canadensis]|uniref:vegetative cell wall protein gp1-like n=1 Tax=Cervus canadensis TaxID=1574408 RepID=UPI001C9E2D2A|nr:vegetative cell wall protein gp1-like [Cervus canadensis]
MWPLPPAAAPLRASPPEPTWGCPRGSPDSSTRLSSILQGTREAGCDSRVLEGLQQARGCSKGRSSNFRSSFRLTTVPPLFSGHIRTFCTCRRFRARDGTLQADTQRIEAARPSGPEAPGRRADVVRAAPPPASLALALRGTVQPPSGRDRSLPAPAPGIPESLWGAQNRPACREDPVTLALVMPPGSLPTPRPLPLAPDAVMSSGPTLSRRSHTRVPHSPHRPFICAVLAVGLESSAHNRDQGTWQIQHRDVWPREGTAPAQPLSRVVARPGPPGPCCVPPDQTPWTPLCPHPSPGPLDPTVSPQPGPPGPHCIPQSGPLDPTVSPQSGPLDPTVSPQTRPSGPHCVHTSPGPLDPTVSPQPGPPGPCCVPPDQTPWTPLCPHPSPGPLDPTVSPQSRPLDPTVSTPQPGPLDPTASPQPEPLDPTASPQSGPPGPHCIPPARPPRPRRVPPAQAAPWEPLAQQENELSLRVCAPDAPSQAFLIPARSTHSTVCPQKTKVTNHVCLLSVSSSQGPRWTPARGHYLACR